MCSRGTCQQRHFGDCCSRPKAKGLAVPGMPAGSPGMGGGQPQRFTVVLFGPDRSKPFMRFIGNQAVGGSLPR